MKHYIIVEVDTEAYKVLRHTTKIRKAIHQTIKDHDIKASDVIIREDRERTAYGYPEPHKEIAELFDLLRYQAKHMKSSAALDLDEWVREVRENREDK